MCHYGEWSTRPDRRCRTTRRSHRRRLEVATAVPEAVVAVTLQGQVDLVGRVQVAGRVLHHRLVTVMVAWSPRRQPVPCLHLTAWRETA